jgi:predicted SprT family Zn-dependent metalloprotease
MLTAERATPVSYETQTPSEATYSTIEDAYRIFNEKLFAGRLPHCLITVQRRNKCYGYFAWECWRRADGNAVTDEIALNPDHFIGRPIIAVLSTLAHEMVHLEQFHFGKASRKGYHNKEWADWMARIGLVASDTAAPGGKRTGQRVSHYIEKGGRFEDVAQALVDSGFVLPWLFKGNDDKAKKKSASKTKYTCETCGLNAWAKPETSLMCGECGTELEAADAV